LLLNGEGIQTKDNNSQINRKIENNKLQYQQLVENQLWTIYPINLEKSTNWSYSAEFALLEAENDYTSQELVLEVKNAKKEKKANIMFKIQPINQSYGFGFDYKMPGNQYWSYEAIGKDGSALQFKDVYNPIIKFRKSSDTRNILTIKKSNNKVELFINYHLIDTIQIDESNNYLNSVTGVGIVTSKKSTGTVKPIALSR
jgi:hypothetical protein